MGYYNNELYHHGVKGMKWGVRRFQNKDGSLTNAGRKRYDQDDDGAARRKSVAKKVVGLTIMGATVATAAVLYAKNPAVNKVVKSVGKTAISALNSGKNKAVQAGKNYMKEAVTGFKEGAKEAKEEAPEKAAKNTVHKVTKSIAKKTVSFLYTGKDKAVQSGKNYITKAVIGVKEGAKEAINEAPKKAAKTIVSGVVMNTAKRAVDKAVGKEESARIFKANNSKKIDSFWKVNERDDDD